MGERVAVPGDFRVGGDQPLQDLETSAEGLLGLLGTAEVHAKHATIDVNVGQASAELLVGGSLADQLLEEVAGLPPGDVGLGMPPSLAEDVGAVELQRRQILADDGRGIAPPGQVNLASSRGNRRLDQPLAENQRRLESLAISS